MTTSNSLQHTLCEPTCSPWRAPPRCHTRQHSLQHIIPSYNPCQHRSLERALWKTFDQAETIRQLMRLLMCHTCGAIPPMWNALRLCTLYHCAASQVETDNLMLPLVSPFRLWGVNTSPPKYLKCEMLGWPHWRQFAEFLLNTSQMTCTVGVMNWFLRRGSLTLGSLTVYQNSPSLI
eukprot:8161766-Pyramimonas_sp.AAC.2